MGRQKTSETIKNAYDSRLTTLKHVFTNKVICPTLSYIIFISFALLAFIAINAVRHESTINCELCAALRAMVCTVL